MDVEKINVYFVTNIKMLKVNWSTFESSPEKPNKKNTKYMCIQEFMFAIGVFFFFKKGNIDYKNTHISYSKVNRHFVGNG